MMEKPKGCKTKHKYAVYRVGTGTGVYARDFCNEFIGETFAVSPEQACNQVRFRETRCKTLPNGEYSTLVIGDRLEEGSVFFKYKAELIF